MAALFSAQLATYGRADSPLCLDLGEARLDDPAVATLLVEVIRQVAGRVGDVRILRPPELLAQGLHRAGAAVHGAASVQVIEPRRL